MKSKLNIFFVSAEVSPFTHPGGLSDVSGALPKYLKNLGHDIRVMMPNYKSVNERKYVLRDVIRLQGLKITIGDETYEASAKSAFIPDSKVQIYFLDNKHFFDRAGIYVDSETGTEFEDNAERYFFFSVGCLETLKLLHWQPDIIHCNDWQTAIIPILLKTVYREDPFFKNTKTLLSIHNLAHQGKLAPSVVKQVGIGRSLSTENGGGANDQGASVLKVGSESADLLNPVSESTLFAIQQTDFRDGIGDVFIKRKNEVWAVNTGVDEQVWNPEKDRLIPFNYSHLDHFDKNKNKQELLNRVGLEYKDKTPVICTTTHFMDDKSNDLILSIIDQFMKMELLLIVLGIGREQYYKKLKAIQKKHAHKFALELRFDHALAHLMVAGSDIFLMPYQLESGGLNQLYSLAYGTIPIVSKSGGTADTIDNVDPDGDSGNGFVLNDVSPAEIVKLTKEAIRIYHKKDVWSRVMQTAMTQDSSWKSPAQKYVKLYQRLLSNKSLSK